MEPTSPMASLIGFDSTHGAANAAGRGRRSTDPGNERFAEVYDLATYAASGSRDAARVRLTPAPLSHVLPVANAATLTVAPHTPAPVDDPAVRAAADRLFLHLTTDWNPAGAAQGGAPMVLRLQDADGTQLAERMIPAYQDDGPEVA